MIEAKYSGILYGGTGSGAREYDFQRLHLVSGAGEYEVFPSIPRMSFYRVPVTRMYVYI